MELHHFEGDRVEVPGQILDLISFDPMQCSLGYLVSIMSSLSSQLLAVVEI